MAAAGKFTVQATMFELIGLRKDDTEFPIGFQPGGVGTAKSTLFITGIIRDISERVRAEEALRASEARFRPSWITALPMIFIKDLEGRYLQINRKIEQTFHIMKLEIAGKTGDEFFPLEQAAAWQANDRQVLESGVPMEFEETAILDKNHHTYIVMKFPAANASGRLLCLYAA